MLHEDVMRWFSVLTFGVILGACVARTADVPVDDACVHEMIGGDWIRNMPKESMLQKDQPAPVRLGHSR